MIGEKSLRGEVTAREVIEELLHEKENGEK